MKKQLCLLLCMIACMATNAYATDYLAMLRDVNNQPIDANKYYAISNGASTETVDYSLRGIRSSEGGTSSNFRLRIAAEKLGVNQAYLAWKFESVTDGSDTKFKIFSPRLKAEKSLGYIKISNTNNAQGGGNMRPDGGTGNATVFKCETGDEYEHQFRLINNTDYCIANTAMPQPYAGVYSINTYTETVQEVQYTRDYGLINKPCARWHFTPVLLLTMEVKNTSNEAVAALLPIINNTTVTYDFSGTNGHVIYEPDCQSQNMVAVSENISSISLGSEDLDNSIVKYVVTIGGTATEYTNEADAIYALNGRIGYDATLTVVVDPLRAAKGLAIATIDSYETDEAHGDYYYYDAADLEAARTKVNAATSEVAINTALAGIPVSHPVTAGATIKLWSNRTAYMYADDGLKIQPAVDVKNIWVAKATSNEGQFYLYNPYTGKYAGSTGNNSGTNLGLDTKIPVVDEANACPYSFEAEYPYVKIHDMSSGRNSSYQYMHAVSRNDVVHWQAQSHAQEADSYWKVYDISYDEISASFHALADADKLNEAKNHIGTKVGQVTIADTDAMDAAMAANTLAKVIAALPASKFLPVVNLPRTNTFIRLKSVANDKYAAFKEGMDETYEGHANAPSAFMVNESDEDFVLANTLFYVDNSRHLIGYFNGRYGDRGLRAIKVGSAEKSVYTFAPSSNQANFTGFNYMTVFSSLGYYPWLAAYENNVNNEPAYAQGSREWEIAEVESLPVQFKAAAKGYATLYTPVALDVPEGVRAFKGTFGEGVIVLEDLTVIPAGTAVLLKKTVAPAEDTWVDFDINDDGTPETTTAIAGANNRFRGQAASFNKTAGAALTLGLNDGNIGFYSYSGSTLRGFSAYIEKTELQDNGVSGVRGLALVFGDDVATAIQTVLEAESGKVVYDLNGCRVQKAGNGVYVVNGKKIIIK